MAVRTWSPVTMMVRMPALYSWRMQPAESGLQDDGVVGWLVGWLAVVGWLVSWLVGWQLLVSRHSPLNQACRTRGLVVGCWLVGLVVGGYSQLNQSSRTKGVWRLADWWSHTRSKEGVAGRLGR